MTLLSLDDVRDGLDKEFLPLEPMLTGFRLIPKCLPDEDVDGCERRLGVSFPEAFRKLISAFDFGNLTIGPVSFSAAGDYLAELVDFNESVHWWGASDKRPQDFIMIANSDPFVFLLNVKSGQVYAFDRERDWSELFRVSIDFTGFLRGIGSVMLLHNSVTDTKILGENICMDAQGENKDFWSFLAS